MADELRCGQRLEELDDLSVVLGQRNVPSVAHHVDEHEAAEDAVVQRQRERRIGRLEVWGASGARYIETDREQSDRPSAGAKTSERKPSRCMHAPAGECMPQMRETSASRTIGGACLEAPWALALAQLLAVRHPRVGRRPQRWQSSW